MKNIVVLIPWRDEPSRRIGQQGSYLFWRGHVDWYVGFYDSDTSKPFNRAQARNNGARKAKDWDIAVFADACIVPETIKQINKAVGLANDGYLVHCYSTLHWLEYQVRVVKTVNHSLAGGIVAISRELFDSVDGYDERFIGWGGEDNALNWACSTFSRVKEVSGAAYHFSHDRLDRDKSSLAYAKNQELLDQYRNALGNRNKMRKLIDSRRP